MSELATISPGEVGPNSLLGLDYRQVEADETTNRTFMLKMMGQKNLSVVVSLSSFGSALFFALPQTNTVPVSPYGVYNDSMNDLNSPASNWLERLMATEVHGQMNGSSRNTSRTAKQLVGHAITVNRSIRLPESTILENYGNFHHPKRVVQQVVGKARTVERKSRWANY